MAFEAQVQANVDVTSGITFAATFTPIDILGLVQIKYTSFSTLSFPTPDR